MKKSIKWQIALSFLCFSGFLVFFFSSALEQRKSLLDKYNTGIEKYNNQDYQEAQQILYDLGNYRDSVKYSMAAEEAMITFQYNDKIYEEAIQFYKKEKYKQSLELFEQISDFKESRRYIEDATRKIKESNNNRRVYKKAIENYKSNKLIEAISQFSKLGAYKNSEQLLKKCKFRLSQLQQADTISAGIRYSTGIIKNGYVKYAGDYPKLEEELSLWENIISVSIQGHLAIGLKNDGSVVVAGHIPNYPDYYIDTSLWKKIISVSAGQQYIVGLRSDGTLVAQGHNGDGQLNIGDWSNIVSIATGWRHTVGLDSNGKIHITGFGSDAQLQQIENAKNEWRNIVAVSAGGGNSGELGRTAFTVGLRADGTVVTTGSSAEKISEWKDIIAISAGDFHTVGLKLDGTVVTTQTGNSAEKISKWKDIVAISAGYGFTLGLREDGKIVAAGFDHNGQIDTESWKGVVNYEEEWKTIFNSDLRWIGFNGKDTNSK